MVCEPLASADVVNDACPEALSATPAARTAAPSRNVTVPVVTGEPAVTVAVKVTGAPRPDGFCDDTIVVAVVTVVDETTLAITMLSMITPHACPGLTSAQVPKLSCV